MEGIFDMKMMVIALLGFCFSLPSFADAGSVVRGREALRLTQAFEKAGVYTDCGLGTCGFDVGNAQCLIHGNSTGRRSFECNFDGPDESGATVQMSANGTKAQSLYARMVEAGLAPDCGMGTCGVFAESLQCRSHRQESGHSIYRCQINP